MNSEADAAPEKSSWLDAVGDFFKDVGADVVNGLASVGNAMIHHPGELATAVAEIGLTLVSAGGDGLGVALDATGVGAVAGVPLNIVSTAGIVTGVGLTTARGAPLMQHAATTTQSPRCRAAGRPEARPEDRPAQGAPDREGPRRRAA